MAVKNIGFLGGCINRQQGLAGHEYYYEVFSGLLAAYPHRLSTGIYISFDRMAARAENFINQNELDVLFLVIRQFPLMPLHKPVIKYENSRGGVSRAFHPALFHRKLQWNDAFTKNHTLHEYVHKDKWKFGLRDANLLAGDVLGLSAWALQYVMQEVARVRHICRQKGIQLYVLSTQQYPTSAMGDRICKKISAGMVEACLKEGIKFINLIHIGPDYFADDRVHFSPEGHNLIAHIVYDEFVKDLKDAWLLTDGIEPSRERNKAGTYDIAKGREY